MKKRLISTLLVAAMAVSLVACGGGDKRMQPRNLIQSLKRAQTQMC